MTSTWSHEQIAGKKQRERMTAEIFLSIADLWERQSFIQSNWDLGYCSPYIELVNTA